MLATLKRQLKGIKERLAEAGAAREPVVTLTEEERIAALTRLYATVGRDNGSAAKMSPDEIRQWSHELAKRSMAIANNLRASGARK